ncbi:FixH family protein [Ectobacillus sp. JY-23]|uniref:FixH family protein n=1 Tax=Ectobacillus sp. JY-23 TaxID=2933872 RepID=UPI001FF434AB|nr:FixH family protein [Ectobacillus sp. JY-23]UOY92581.1 FixH family protein [Ectobacillus sp. JY-23]
MKKWLISAVVYLVVVIGGYAIYSSINDESETASHTESHEKKETHAHGTAVHTESEVNVTANYKEKSIEITLQDKTGKPVEELEVNHEKILHLIVVDEHLDKYYHLHPTDLGKGVFTVEQELPTGTYKAFVDIKPKNLSYEVAPIVFTVGEPKEAHAHGLQADTTLTKEIDGKQVTMKLSATKAKEPVTLQFDLDESTLEPYLGAMGHVVILDDKAQEYLHVHPADQNQPVFSTTFKQPGIYKIWAEFKQNGVVRVFPFVVEIQP